MWVQLDNMEAQWRKMELPRFITGMLRGILLQMARRDAPYIFT